MTELLKILEEAATDGIIECRGCGNSIEPDCPKCGDCNWINPIVSMGMI